MLSSVKHISDFELDHLATPILSAGVLAAREPGGAPRRLQLEGVQRGPVRPRRGPARQRLQVEVRGLRQHARRRLRAAVSQLIDLINEAE